MRNLGSAARRRRSKSGRVRSAPLKQVSIIVSRSLFFWGGHELGGSCGEGRGKEKGGEGKGGGGEAKGNWVEGGEGGEEREGKRWIEKEGKGKEGKEI